MNGGAPGRFKALEDMMDTFDRDQKTPAPQQQRKPYTAPKLVYLGEVRELTANGAGSVNEALVGKRKKAM